ncbi:hypothetical protein GCM10010261_64180 [Streptomyces pilosus]|nr:hypothetical protein GCM10010261_64180 [Streptomyces pilosus]
MGGTTVRRTMQAVTPKAGTVGPETAPLEVLSAWGTGGEEHEYGHGLLEEVARAAAP